MSKQVRRYIIQIMIGFFLIVALNIVIYRLPFADKMYATIFCSSFFVGILLAIFLISNRILSHEWCNLENSMIATLLLTVIYVLRFSDTRGVLPSFASTPIVLESNVTWFLPTCGYLTDFFFAFFISCTLYYIFDYLKNKERERLFKRNKLSIKCLLVPLAVSYVDTIASVIHNNFLLPSQVTHPIYRTISKLIPPALIWYFIIFLGAVLLIYPIIKDVEINTPIAIIGICIVLLLLISPEYAVRYLRKESIFVQNLIGTDYHAIILFMGAGFSIFLKSLLSKKITSRENNP